MNNILNRIPLWPILAIFACLGLFAFAFSLIPFAQAEVTSAPGGGTPDISLSPFASGLSAPVDIANAGDDRLFVVEQAGVIKVVQSNGTVLSTPFLDISARVEYGGEQGLLGLAFDPDYANNGYFYVNYTYCTDSLCPDFGNTPNLYTRVSRFSVTADPNITNPDSEVILLVEQQPYGNHNGGDINFGPDGYLYIGMGDGGSGGDPENRAQNGMELLGKMLRIDVDGGGQAPDCYSSGLYTIPADNPFVGAANTCDEIWAFGLRNPWRFSFDRETGDMYIGDVGQGAWEEVNFQPASSNGGENWGWRCYEGNHPYNTSGCVGNYDFPFHEYSQSGQLCAVTGGYVYRGGLYPVLNGHYVFADYCKGDVWTAVNNGGWTVSPQGDLGNSFTSFGEGADGELYLSSSNGTIYHIVENTVVQTQTPTPSTTPSNTPTPTLTPTPTQPINLTPIATGFLEPVDVEHAGDDRLFVAERGGYVYEVASDGTVNPTPLLDISDRVLTDFWQQGLLSIAFHPDFATNGYLYTHYTDLNGDIVISRFTHSGTLTATQAIDPTTEFIILPVAHPNTSDENNGGELVFGPDGYLYISLGDGGRPDNAQDVQSLLGKVLRIDVDGGSPYAIPPDNPFVGVSNAQEEIWALGLRNPWRFGFDSETDDMYLGDVGNNQREEVDLLPATSSGGENFGWSCFEGNAQGVGYDPDDCTDTYVSPLHEYDHSVGSVVVGGYTYRGCRYDDMIGKYYFADFVAGKLWFLDVLGEETFLINTSQQFSSFGQGVDGELYALGYDVGTSTGILYHLAGNIPGSCYVFPYNLWIPVIYMP